MILKAGGMEEAGVNRLIPEEAWISTAILYANCDINVPHKLHFYVKYKLFKKLVALQEDGGIVVYCCNKQ